jgi:hypothetical protein
MAPKKKAANPTMCQVCGEKPATHQGPDKQQLCDTCDKPAAPAQPGRKIIAMQVENVKRIKLVRFRPKGSTVIFAGKNGSGKTSMLDAYDFAIRGTTKIPSQPIRKGARTATVQIDFGDFKVERTFTRIDGGKEPYLTKLNVYGKNKEKYPTPQTLIDAWNRGTTFDPLAFARMEPRKQLETLRRMVTLDVDLDAIEAAKKMAYDARRDAGRDVDAAKARLNAFAVPDPKLPEEMIDTAALTKQLEEAANHNNLVAAQEQAKLRKIEQADAREQRTYDITAEIEQLQLRIKALQEEKATATDDARRMRKEAEHMEVGKLTDTAEVAAQLTRAGQTNDSIRHRNAYRMAVKSVTMAEESWAKQDAIVKAKEQERIDAIARAKFPISGLSFSDDEVLYNELPFVQASHAEQIRVSVSLGIAWNPELKIMLIRDGDLLDDDTFALVEGMIAKSDHQLLIERIDAGGRPCITMEDGEASGDQVEIVPAR